MVERKMRDDIRIVNRAVTLEGGGVCDRWRREREREREIGNKIT